MITATAPTLTITVRPEDIDNSTAEGGVRWITARAEGGGLVRLWADEDTMRALVRQVTTWRTATVAVPLHNIEGAI